MNPYSRFHRYYYPGRCTQCVYLCEYWRSAVEAVKKPVIVKETGAGISYGVAKKLHAVGVSAIDVGGLGGTSLAAAEIYRAKAEEDELGEHLENLFGWDWGIPTVESIVERSAFSIPVIATGGIRNGLDGAKSIVLGADLCSAAVPFLKPAMENVNADKVETTLSEHPSVNSQFTHVFLLLYSILQGLS